MSTENKLQVEDDYLVRLIKAENRIAKLEAEQAKDTDSTSGDETENSENTEGETADA